MARVCSGFSSAPGSQLSVHRTKLGPLGEEEPSGPFPDSTGFLALGQSESSLLLQEPRSVSSPSSGGQRTLCLLG